MGWQRYRSALMTVLLGAAVACGAPVSTQPTAPAPPASAATLASGPASADAPGGGPSRPLGSTGSERLAVTVRPNYTELGGKELKASCDFQRLYRGTIGKTAVSVLLRRAGAELSGEVHYDRPGRGIPIARGASVTDGRFQFREAGAGRFEGRCDPASGALTGSYSLRGQSTPFALQPRPAGWPGLFGHRRATRVDLNHPACAGQAARDRIVSIPVGPHQSAYCLPSSVAERRALRLEGKGFCLAEDEGLRLFGLPTGVLRRANEVLASTEYRNDVKSIQQCHRLEAFYTSSSVMFVGHDVLTVQAIHTADFGGAHPLNGVRGGTSVDLRNGRQLELTDLIREPQRLRDLVATCLTDFDAASATDQSAVIPRPAPSVATCDGPPGDLYLWGCDPNLPNQGPKWALVDGGIAILATGHVHAEAYLDGHGPILSWATLLREGLLHAQSPVARLWQGVAPAPAGAPACTSAYTGDTVRSWRVISSRDAA